jgi:replicative DNA helicase
MTVSLEKIFFAFITKNKRYFEIIDVFFFKNVEIQFVYNIIRNYMIKGGNIEMPTPKQILEMVNLEDRDGIITKDILKSILSVNLGEYDEENFIIPKFNAWILSNKLKHGTVDIIDETRNLDNVTDFDSAIQAANRIRGIVDQMSSTSFVSDDDLGSDFDDPEHHLQDTAKYKIRSGFDTIDHMLGGGWDIMTLNVIMAETNNGKSLWMQNFAVRSADLGYNVLYITLEMSERKVMKRVGSMRLKIPINDYDRVSKDTELIKKKIENLKNSSNGVGNDLFEKKIGKIITKFWAAGTTTVNDFDNYISKLRDKRGIKIDLIIVDYITLIAPVKGTVGGDNLFSKGKVLAEGLRAIGAKYKAPVITGVQVSKDAWNSNDITLEQVPESKAIAETADSFFAIIRTEEMKRQNLFRFKLLKQRDGDFLKAQIKVNLNTTYLTLENDVFLDSV